MRTFSSEIAGSVGKSVTIAGWLHKKRAMGGINFINVRDRTGLTQIVVEDKDQLEKLRGMQIGTVLEISGKVKAEPRAPGGAEIHSPEIRVAVPVVQEPPIEIDKPLSHKPENLDTLFDHRPLGLRNLQEQTIFRVQAAICRIIRDYFYDNGFTEIHTPKLLAEATEGGAEVFTLTYFDKTATLAQSPQFYKQIMVGVYERVFEIAPVFRAELSATTRHMSEYTSIDAEMGFIAFEDLKKFLSDLLGKITNEIWSGFEPELKKWNAAKPILSAKIPELTIDEIHELYKKSNSDDFSGEDDLAPAEEKWICDWAKKNRQSEAVFVTGWSARSKTFKFYHRVNEENPEIADRADLLFRGVEIVTLSMREHRFDKLMAQMTERGLDLKDTGFWPLLSVMEYGMPPHGGFGMGLERLTQRIVGLNNIKEATLFPRDINRLTP